MGRDNWQLTQAKSSAKPAEEIDDGDDREDDYDRV
jgi:hypothetical protein